MEERDFFDEKEETKSANINCPSCRQSFEYAIRWRRRTKKKALPRHADSDDRARFAKARDYMVRVDDFVKCKGPRCGKRIEITSQSVVLL